MNRIEVVKKLDSAAKYFESMRQSQSPASHIRGQEVLLVAVLVALTHLLEGESHGS